MNNVMSAADYWATPKKEKAPAGTEAIKDSNHVEQIITAAQKIGNSAPDVLRNLPGWLIWRYEQHEGEPKPRKVPHYANGNRRHGVQGRPEDRQHLTTFEAASAAAERRGFDGVGLALMPDFNVVALDFDNCMVEGGVHPDVERLVASTYAEYSPSGNGVRAFMRGDLGNSKSHGEPFGFEVFSSKGFVTFTGKRLDITDLLGTGNTLAEISDDVQAMCAARFGAKASQDTNDDPLMAYEPVLGLTAEQIAEALDVMDPDLGHDDWLHVGMGLHHETAGDGFAHWDEWSAKGSKYPGEDELRKRWDSFGSTSGRPVTARSLVKLANKNGAHINLEDPAAFMATTKPGESLRFQVVPAGEFSRGKRPGWIIKGVIPLAELVVLFGESGSGKSFLALDIGAAIARGIAWRGHRTRQGRVVYIAAEGGGGFRNRLAAYQQHHDCNLDEIPFGIIHAAPNFLQKTDAQDITKAILAGGRADVIIVDTFAQVIPGANENAAEDIGKALAHCKGIHRTTGAVVVLVHHAGKDPTKGARGWSGLRAAADAEIEVTRSVAGRKVRISKQKDGDDGKEWGFDLEVVPIGIDEDGDVIDSCIVKEAEVPVASSIDPKRRLGRWEKLVLDAISEIALGQNAGIEVDAVLTEAVRRSPPAEAGGRDTRRQLARRALLTLCKGDEAPFFLEDGCLSVM
jgi:hypothetical protein